MGKTEGVELDLYDMKPCSTCASRWTRNALWYCRKTTIAAAKLIGNEIQMKSAKGCASWRA